MKNKDMPAMPIWTNYMDLGETAGSGLSKLEHFAGLAMQNCLESMTDNCKEAHLKHMAEFCVKASKALLEELEKENG